MNNLRVLVLIFILCTGLFVMTGERYYTEGFKFNRRKLSFHSKFSKILQKARKSQKRAIEKATRSMRHLKQRRKYPRRPSSSKPSRRTKSSNNKNDLSGNFSAAKLNSQFDLKTQDPNNVARSVDQTQKKVEKKQSSGVRQINAHSDSRTNQINHNVKENYRQSIGGGGGGAKTVKKFAKKAFKSTTKFARKSWKSTTKFAKKTWKSGTKAVGKSFKKVGKSAKKFFCFSGDTPIKLSVGITVSMKDIKLGDVLINGETVDATMRIKSNIHDPFYRIYSREIGDYIYVTGSHYVQNNLDEYIHVRDFDRAERLETVDDTLYCLVTSEHTIPVGEYTFSDWETDQFEEID